MVVEISHTNETKGWRLGEPYYDDVDAETPGELYRLCRREFGRCRSRVYIDGADGKPMHVGWFFVRREEYRDSPETYLRGTWVTVLASEPHRVRDYVDLGEIAGDAREQAREEGV